VPLLQKITLLLHHLLLPPPPPPSQLESIINHLTRKKLKISKFVIKKEEPEGFKIRK
jgi:hypothetical protein